jgi:EAL domain-containing protein (putative c-di-GMP-specific phosphodiesterase class I)
MFKIHQEPSEFVQLDALSTINCGSCGTSERLGFQFDFAYQPIVDVAGRSIYAHEALVRGPAGEGALTVLSQVTEHNRYRFDQACRVKAIKTAAQLGMKERLSINFLPNAVYKPEVCIRTTLEAARAHGFPIDHIIFEVTEGERVEDGPWLASILREYKLQGFLTAIDDFGAGYAGLTLLADFTPDLIKLDMALVRGVEASKSRQAIARGLLRICQEIGITVIAEGVETTSERDFFLHEGVTLMQGYLFAKPAFRASTSAASVAWALPPHQ